ncbi:immunoglobulin E-set, partial [Tricladium varicosporioides]
ASEVYVTGTFDNWGKTHKLYKNSKGVFQKFVEIPTSHKIYYKFVVDGNWVTNHTAPQEADDSGNLNNV